MSTRPGEHQGLGLAHYLWASSPLRRYSDLVNQRQLLAVVAGERAAVRRQRRRALRGAGRLRGDLLRSTPSSRTGWSTTGACAGCCRKASTETTAHGHPRQPRPLRPAAARRAPRRTCRRCAPDARVRVAHRAHRPPRRDAGMPLRRAARGLIGAAVQRPDAGTAALMTRHARATMRRLPSPIRRVAILRRPLARPEAGARRPRAPPPARAGRPRAASGAARARRRARRAMAAANRCCRVGDQLHRLRARASIAIHAVVLAIHFQPFDLKRCSTAGAAARGRAGQRQDASQADQGRHPRAGEPRRRRQHRRRPAREDAAAGAAQGQPRAARSPSPRRRSRRSSSRRRS